MERIVLLRSCHTTAATSPCALPSLGDELHVTISVTYSESAVGTPRRDGTPVATSEPIAEDLLGVNKPLGGSAMVHTVIVPLAESSDRIVIEDVTTNQFFHSSSEVSIICVMHSHGVASSSPLFSAYSKVADFLPTCNPHVTVVQHVGLRVANDSTGICITVAKAPVDSSRDVEGALATEHLRCYNDNVVQWQLERAFLTKNAAVDALIQSDLLLSDEIKRQRTAISSSQLPQGCSVGDDEVTLLKARVKELELERVKELEAMRRLIAERRAEREAHIEARLKESKPVTTRTPQSKTSGSGLHGLSSASSAGRVTPVRNLTPSRTSAARVTSSSSTPHASSGFSASSSQTQRAGTPSRGPSAATSKTGTTLQRSATPTSVAAHPERRLSSSASVTSVGKSSTSRTGFGASSSVSAVPSSQAAMLKRAEDNLQKLRGGGIHQPSPSTSGRVGSLVGRTSPSVSMRTSSPQVGRSVPPPPPDIRASPMRAPTTPLHTSTLSSGTAPTRRILAESPVRSGTPTGARQVATRGASPLIRNNTQSLIRMARQ